MKESPRDIRRWLRSWQAVNAREQRERREVKVDQDHAVRSALSLVALTAQIQGWPPPEDAVSTRQAQHAHDAWDRLRRGWPPG